MSQSAKIFLTSILPPRDRWMGRPGQTSRTGAGVRLRLFCFFGQRAGAAMFRAWPEGLPEEVQVCAVHLPEPLAGDLGTLAVEVAAVLRPYLDLPFAFFGHGMGAALAFEVTRHLRRTRGALPVHLLVSGQRAPQLRAAGEDYVCAPEAPLECPLSAFGGTDERLAALAELGAWREQTGAFGLDLLPGCDSFLSTARAQFLDCLGRRLRPHLQAAHKAGQADRRPGRSRRPALLWQPLPLAAAAGME